MKYILVKTIRFTVDDDDYERVSGYKWHLDTMGYPRWRDNPKKKTISMHRLIINCPDGMVVDHINGDITDNQKHNLRICTRGQNSYNAKKQSFTSSQFKGVSLHTKRQKWQAKIYADKKLIFIGWFDNELDAAAAYNKAAIQYHGKYARLNAISA